MFTESPKEATSACGGELLPSSTTIISKRSHGYSCFARAWRHEDSRPCRFSVGMIIEKKGFVFGRTIWGNSIVALVKLGVKRLRWKTVSCLGWLPACLQFVRNLHATIRFSVVP